MPEIMTSTLFQSSLLALNKDATDANDVTTNGHVANGDVRGIEKIPTNVFVDRLIASDDDDDEEEGLSEGEMEQMLLEGARHVPPKQRHSAKLVPLEMDIADDETTLDVASGKEK